MHHPETHIVDLVCANCGQTHRLRSTAASISVEIRSNCHPAYTGLSRTTVR